MFKKLLGSIHIYYHLFFQTDQIITKIKSKIRSLNISFETFSFQCLKCHFLREKLVGSLVQKPTAKVETREESETKGSIFQVINQ